jgi:hypothetical protein
MRVLAVAQTAKPAELAAAQLVRPSLEETDLNEVLRLLTATGYGRPPAGY